MPFTPHLPKRQLPQSLIVSFLLPLSGLALAGNAAASADEHHHTTEDAHVHGIAELTIAQEGNVLELNLKSPAANIVGFEHKASTPEQSEAVEAAEKTLESSSQLFSFSGTECQLKQAKVDVSAIASDEHGGDHEHEQDHHDDKEGHDHGHDADHEEEHKGEEHAHHDKEEHHDHDDHHKGEEHHDHDEHDNHHEGHSDILASYHFNCEQGSKLTAISVELLDLFSGIEKLKTMWVTDAQQGGADLSASSKTIRLQ